MDKYAHLRPKTLKYVGEALSSLPDELQNLIWNDGDMTLANIYTHPKGLNVTHSRLNPDRLHYREGKWFRIKYDGSIVHEY